MTKVWRPSIWGCFLAYIRRTFSRQNSCLGTLQDLAWWILRSSASRCVKIRELPNLLKIVQMDASRESVDVRAVLRHFETHQNLQRISCWRFSPAAMAAMPHELKVKTLEGGVITVEVTPRNTIQELKAMLHEKKQCEDPIEHKILKVKVLANGLLLDDDQTLESAGLLHAESEVTVIYSRNEVEAATKEAIHEEGFLQVNIPSSLTEIPAEAFEDYHQVVTVAIPESVTVIGEAAFAGCKYLASITIPASVTSIGHYAFFGCSSLESITIPESVTAIRDRAFLECSSLVSITIPKSVTAIKVCAFRACRSLASITIPESVTAIEELAFAYCVSLESINIPESVTAIRDSAFLGCISLVSITIPASVTVIGESAFRGCRSLVSINIPESVRVIGESAFRGCSSLGSITIPESVRDVGKHAFEGCSFR